MRVLVTGHNGYLGSVMVPVLKGYGHDVTGLDTYFFEDCTLIGGENDVPSLRKDIRDLTAGDLDGFDAIVHLAALSNDPLGDLKPDWTYEINAGASIGMARLAKEAGVERFLYSSSCSIYGASDVNDIVTEDAPLNPITAYAVSKVAAEKGISALGDSSFSPVIMRNATAYGFSPRLRADIVLNNLVAWAHTTGRVRIMSDGTPWRPLVHVADIGRAFAAVLAARRETVHNQAFNVGSNEENYQIRDLAEIVRDTVPNCEIEFGEGRGADPRSYRVDFTKLGSALPGFQPAWNARLGARELYDSYVRGRLTLQDFEGRKYIRLSQIKHLLDSGRLHGALRWTA